MTATAAIARKPRLPFIQILTMCFGFFGIQMGFALQTGHFSRVFTTLGADMNALPILWIAGPVTGLILQPIVGYFSDRTWTRLGRRRPYFLWGALATSAGLLIMPSSSALWMAAGMLWILDSSLNITMEPFRAYVGDMLPEEQRTTGYAAQSFFIGAGGTLGSALPWILANWAGVSNEATSTSLPANIQYTFYIGAVLLLLSVLVTVIRGREYDPETLAAYEAAEAAARGLSTADMTPMPEAPSAGTYQTIGLSFIAIGLAIVFGVYMAGIEQELYILGGGIATFGLLALVAGLTKGKGEKGMFGEIMEDMFRLPKTMRQLAFVQFFSWFAMFSMWIYLNDGAIQHHYGAPGPDTEVYQSAGDWLALLGGVYFAVAAIVAFAIPVLARATSRKVAHSICLVVGALGFSSFIWLPSPELLWISMIGVGVVWASILSMPYAILSNALPADKMGIYMGIFNFFIVIPQLLAATILGLIVTRFFGGYAIFALGLGAASFVVAAGLALLVDDPGDAPKQES